MKGWFFLTIILDLYDRKVIGLALGTDMSAENTTIAAWRMAIKNDQQQNLSFFIQTEVFNMPFKKILLIW
ncbi:MAG: hypothetical protein IPO32_17400 [Crocinitomicaceae bacterium]|nr:hypothetical protein [Crocinitomicaceae bacterium]